MKFTKVLSLILCLLLAVSLFACGEPETPDTPDVPADPPTTTDFKVTVVDQNGDAVAGAKVMFYGTKDGKDYFGRPIEVDANGVATDKLSAVDGIEIRMPDGYEPLPKDADDYHGRFEAGKTELTIVATKVASGEVEYTVKVVDENGEAVEGIGVQLCHNVCLEAVDTDENGEVKLSFIPNGKVKVKLIIDGGYTIEAIDAEGYHAYFADGETSITVTVNTAE